MKMKVVTGAAGFIGSNLVAALEQTGDEIAVCDWLEDPAKMCNLAKRTISHEIRPEKLFDFLGNYPDQIDTVFILGAISSTTATNVPLITKVNVELPIQIWNWCRDNDIRLIYASSAATYGDGSQGFVDNFSVEELRNLQPLNAYGRSKNQFDNWVAKQISDGAATPPQWAGLKFFNVYGPNEYHKGEQMSLVPQLYEQIVEGGRARLFKSHHPKYKDGGQLRDFIWIGDCISVMKWLDKHPNVSGLFNCGTGEARTFLDLAKSIFTAMGKEIVIDFVPTPKNIRGNYQYFTQANMENLKLSGYSEEFTKLEDGVTLYVSDYLMSEDRYV